MRGIRIPKSLLPIDLDLPEGYFARQDQRFVYLYFGGDDLIGVWNHRRLSHEQLKERVQGRAIGHQETQRHLPDLADLVLFAIDESEIFDLEFDLENDELDESEE